MQLCLNREYNEMNGFTRLWESEAGFQTSMPYLYNLIGDRKVCSDKNIDIQLMIIHGSFLLVELLHPCSSFRHKHGPGMIHGQNQMVYRYRRSILAVAIVVH